MKSHVLIKRSCGLPLEHLQHPKDSFCCKKAPTYAFIIHKRFSNLEALFKLKKVVFLDFRILKTIFCE